MSVMTTPGRALLANAGLVLLVLCCVFGSACSATQCYSCFKCPEPFDPIAYNVKLRTCPDGYNTCIVNYMEYETGERFSIRDCTSSNLCQPGTYYTNNSRVTTKCCANDLCINIIYSPSHARTTAPTVIAGLLLPLLVAFFLLR